MELKFRDLKKEEIDVKINTVGENTCTLLLYKDARVDMDILDETVGAMNWQRRHSRDNANCQIGIYDHDKKEWVWKEDTGTESFAEAEKGLASDSFKRAGTNWGIGRELYTAPKIKIECRSKDKKVLNLFNFKVEDIEIKNKTIIGLKISAYNSDKKVAETIFTWGTKKKNNPMKNIKDEDLPFNDVGVNEPQMTLEEALSIQVKMKDGVEKKLGDLTDDQLETVEKCMVGKYKEGAAVILMFRAGQK